MTTEAVCAMCSTRCTARRKRSHSSHGEKKKGSHEVRNLSLKYMLMMERWFKTAISHDHDGHDDDMRTHEDTDDDAHADADTAAGDCDADADTGGADADDVHFSFQPLRL